MAAGNFRANRSWGCLECGNRDNPEKLVERGKGANKCYLCDTCAGKYDQRRRNREQAEYRKRLKEKKGRVQGNYLATPQEHDKIKELLRGLRG